MHKTMCWRDTGDRLELFVNDSGAWTHYSRHPLAVPDYRIENGSKGYATMQKLLSMGYNIIKDPNNVITGILSMDKNGIWHDR